MDLSKLEVEINPEYTMMKKCDNGLYLSLEQIEVLEMYKIDYLKCHSLRELILEIETLCEECDDDYLNNLLQILSERDYYENYNK